MVRFWLIGATLPRIMIIRRLNKRRKSVYLYS